jgi:hypothetical protein
MTYTLENVGKGKEGAEREIWGSRGTRIIGVGSTGFWGHLVPSPPFPWEELRKRELRKREGRCEDAWRFLLGSWTLAQAGD